MGSRSRYTGPRKIKTGKEKCMRCGVDLNEFRKQPWCFDCGLELQQMEFNGEDLLEMMLAVMPPRNIHAVLVSQMHEIATRAMIHKGILDRPDDAGEPEPPTSPILVP